MFEKLHIDSIAYSQDVNSAIAYRGEITVTQADKVINSVSDLIDDPAYKPFYYKVLYRIGPSRFMEIAERARKGNKPSRLFSTLCK